MDELLSCAARRPGGASSGTIERIRAVFVDSLHLHRGQPAMSHEQMLDQAASIDSIAVLEFLTAVEKEFGVELESVVMEFEFLRDVEALAFYIETRMGEASDPGIKERSRSTVNAGD